jgi:DNA-binding NarL/FixJ family response regulator
MSKLLGKFGRGIVVAIRNDLLRYGVERMVRAIDGASAIYCLPSLRQAVQVADPDRDVVITLLAEVDDIATFELLRAEQLGLRIVLLIQDVDVAMLAKVSRIRGVGFLLVDELSESTLSDTLSRMDRGQVPIPADVAHHLLALIGDRAELVRTMPRLTPREQETLVLMVDGLSNKQIARRLVISEHGAKRLVANILAKLDCANRTIAVAKALREGLYEQFAKQHADATPFGRDPEKLP